MIRWLLKINYDKNYFNPLKDELFGRKYCNFTETLTRLRIECLLEYFVRLPALARKNVEILAGQVDEEAFGCTLLVAATKIAQLNSHNLLRRSTYHLN